MVLEFHQAPTLVSMVLINTMVLSDKQWDGLKRMLGGNSEYTNSLSGHSYITLNTISRCSLSRLSDVQDSYLLTYNNNIEVEIHRYSDVSNYEISYLHTLWNLWSTEQQRYKNELDRIL